MKAINDTMGPNGIDQFLLVFGVLLSLPTPRSNNRSDEEICTAQREPRAELENIVPKK